MKADLRKQINQKGPVLAVLLVFLVLYLVAFFYAYRSTGIYRITPQTNNDRFFSMDDVYYVTSIYSIVPENTLRIVKHPLFMAYGNAFAHVENWVFGEISISAHYALVVCMQILVQLLGLLYLYKILRELYRLPLKMVFVLIGIYACSFSAITYTLVAESYVYSGTVLLVSFYALHQQKKVLSVVTGILAGGITITNLVPWVILALLLLKGIKRKLLVPAIATAVLFGLILLTPSSRMFYENVIFVFFNSPKNYSDAFLVFEALQRVLYAFFGSTFFFVNTAMESPFGQYAGQAISFLPGASVAVICWMAFWLVLLGAAILVGLRKKLLWVPLAVLVFNLLLHGAKQYGLKEGFLYSLHHLPFQILMVASFYKDNKNKLQKALFPVLCVFLLGEILLNAIGLRDFLAAVRPYTG